MTQGVTCDVCHVVIGEAVGNFPAPALTSDDPCPPQDPKVLGHEGLAHPEGVHELMDAAGSVVKLVDHGEAQRIGQGTQEFRTCHETVVDRRLECRCCCLDRLRGHHMRILLCHYCVVNPGHQ
jgi:hypothetical protein